MQKGWWKEVSAQWPLSTTRPARYIDNRLLECWISTLSPSALINSFNCGSMALMLLTRFCLCVPMPEMLGDRFAGPTLAPVSDVAVRHSFTPRFLLQSFCPWKIPDTAWVTADLGFLRLYAGWERERERQEKQENYELCLFFIHLFLNRTEVSSITNFAEAKVFI